MAGEDLSLLNSGFSASSVAKGQASSSLFYKGSVFMIFSYFKGPMLILLHWNKLEFQYVWFLENTNTRTTEVHNN